MHNKVNKKHEPITSYGVINLYFSDELKKYIDTVKTTFNKNSNIDITDIVPEDNSAYNKIYKTVQDNLLFLMVSRKHSLGYIEFIRGNYDISSNESIEHLCVQMTEHELIKIFSRDFDDLWCKLWKRNARKSAYNKEYILALEKFKYVRNNFNVESFKPSFPINEWGFPKGRKNNNETNVGCAIRECCEETSLISDEINILSGVSPLIENMTGTNNVNYKHIYYVSIIDEIRNLRIMDDNNHFAEIDVVGWFKRDKAKNLIRPYHDIKLNIIDEIVKFITYVIYCTEK